MTDDELQASLHAAQRARLRRRLDRAVDAELIARTESANAAAALSVEAGELAGLESASRNRIWSGLGRCASSEREREFAAAQRRAASAQLTLAAATADRQQLAVRLAEFDDPDPAQAAEALAAAAIGLQAAGGSPAAQLAEIADQQASAKAQLAEIGEAQASAQQVAGELELATTLLRNFERWAGLDTYFNGGPLADHPKHSSLDAAHARIKAADAALKTLAAALAKVEIETVGGSAVHDLGRLLDPWFDDRARDRAMRDRIRPALATIDHARATASQALVRLAERDAELRTLQATLAQARERVIHEHGRHLFGGADGSSSSETKPEPNSATAD